MHQIIHLLPVIVLFLLLLLISFIQGKKYRAPLKGLATTEMRVSIGSLLIGCYLFLKKDPKPLRETGAEVLILLTVCIIGSFLFFKLEKKLSTKKTVHNTSMV